MTTTTGTPASTARTSSRGRTIFLTATGVVVGAGLAVGLVLGLGSSTATDSPTAGTPTISTSTGRHPTGGSSSNSGHNTPAAPSAAIETLQKELGQLNYYEGPVTGVMNAQTTQAIEYLQRDAHLPQTGQLNAATRAALANFLANGNNQMAGNNQMGGNS
jgi:peptidoglycan hydrolase-like protein with peptidoglycan-binding domain